MKSHLFSPTPAPGQFPWAAEVLRYVIRSLYAAARKVLRDGAPQVSSGPVTARTFPVANELPPATSSLGVGVAPLGSAFRPVLLAGIGLGCLSVSIPLLARQNQDNWYFWQTSGGLSSPQGVAIGPDGRYYLGGSGGVRAYLASGVLSFSFTNGFGGGLSFSQPLGMTTDSAGNVYIADNGNNCVLELSGNGAFIRKFGGAAGSAPGQLSGVRDVAVSPGGQVYILENGNSRVSSFNPDGSFNSILISSGSLSSQLNSPVSLAISDSGIILVVQGYPSYQGYRNLDGENFRMLKAFDSTGAALFQVNLNDRRGFQDQCNHGIDYLGPCSVRVDRSGLVHVISSACGTYYDCINNNDPNYQMYWRIFNLEGALLQLNGFSFGPEWDSAELSSPCHAVGPDGTLIIADANTAQIKTYLYAKRELDPIPRNASSMPEPLQVTQRRNTTVVDIIYQANDMDDTNTFAAMLVFINGAQSLSNCVRPSSFTEGTGRNICTYVPANQPLHVTWNAGPDLPATNVSSFRVAILAKDKRQGLLDIHYLKLPADRGMPALEISAGPLIQTDFTQVWWWLLATNDPGITLSNSVIYGVGGAYDGLALCNGDNNTTTNGQSYIYAKMNVRQATAAEVAWARLGPNANIVHQWAPTISVGGRPKAVNEYRFDTGNWGSNAWWIVPLQ